MSRDYQPREPREPPDVDPPDQRRRESATGRVVRFTLKAVAIFLCMIVVMCILAFFSIFWWMVAEFGALVALTGVVVGAALAIALIIQILVAFVDALAPF